MTAVIDDLDHPDGGPAPGSEHPSASRRLSGCIDHLRFHHIGLAVAEPKAAFSFLALQGYREGAQVFDPQQKVNLAMRHHAVLPDFEVIWPGDEPSPIDAMVKRRATRLYHCCYEVDDVETTITMLEQNGFDVTLVSPAKPAVLFAGRPVSFYLIDGVGLIELLGPG